MALLAALETLNRRGLRRLPALPAMGRRRRVVFGALALPLGFAWRVIAFRAAGGKKTQQERGTHMNSQSQDECCLLSFHLNGVHP